MKRIRDDNNLHGHDHGHSVQDKGKNRINNSELGHKHRHSAQVKRKA